MQEAGATDAASPRDKVDNASARSHGEEAVRESTISYNVGIRSCETVGGASARSRCDAAGREPIISYK
eukprot:9343324-Pyramimonas_sp.AAC.1